MAGPSLRSKLLTIFGGLFLVIVAAILAAVWIYESQERTYYGRHTNILPSGARVVLAREFRGAPADQVIRRKGDKDYDWPGSAPAGDILAPKDTQAVVEVDPAWDEDSCYPDRPVAIQLISDGSVAVPRYILHR
jgi:hypothetical protein